MVELGKYAGAVLSAYGVSLTLLALLVLHSFRQGRKARTALNKIEKRQRDNG
ncbi:MAG: heme exporter protein CcmD [Sulfitobacter sp.]